MCATMMVFCVCINDSVHLLYISVCGKAVCNLLHCSSYSFHCYGGSPYKYFNVVLKTMHTPGKYDQRRL